MNAVTETLSQLVSDLSRLADSVLPLLSAGVGDVAEADFGLFMFMIMIASGICLLAITAISAIAGILLILIGASGLAAVGLSIDAGLRTRSMRKGFKTFCLSFSALCGSLAAVLLAYGAGLILDFQMGLGSAIAVLITVAISGGGMGWVFYKLLHLVVHAIGRRVGMRASQS